MYIFPFSEVIPAPNFPVGISAIVSQEFSVAYTKGKKTVNDTKQKNDNNAAVIYLKVLQPQGRIFRLSKTTMMVATNNTITKTINNSTKDEDSAVSSKSGIVSISICSVNG